MRPLRGGGARFNDWPDYRSLEDPMSFKNSKDPYLEFMRR